MRTTKYLGNKRSVLHIIGTYTDVASIDLSGVRDLRRLKIQRAHIYGANTALTSGSKNQSIAGNISGRAVFCPFQWRA